MEKGVSIAFQKRLPEVGQRCQQGFFSALLCDLLSRIFASHGVKQLSQTTPHNNNATSARADNPKGRHRQLICTPLGETLVNAAVMFYLRCAIHTHASLVGTLQQMKSLTYVVVQSCFRLVKKSIDTEASLERLLKQWSGMCAVAWKPDTQRRTVKNTSESDALLLIRHHSA